ncbi:ANTAR domain-containing response regulator [Alsobacter sp. SYSU BS001988]|jgi:response regulator NasT
MPKPTRIVIIDQSPVRRAILAEGLHEAGFSDVIHLEGTDRIMDRIVAAEPDIIVIDLESPSRDVLEQMFQVSRAVPRPVAMFVDQSDTSMINAAIDAGVSAYVVDGLRKDRVKPILDMCISRFNAFARLKDELEQAKSQLADRKVIDRAKGILMKAKGVTEEEAYALLRKTAMNEKKKVAEIAQSVVTAAELLR